MEERFFDDWLNNNLAKSQERKVESLPLEGKTVGSPSGAFLDRWVRGLTSWARPNHDPTDISPRSGKSYRKEVRSVFGWTDVSEAEEEKKSEQPTKEQPQKSKLTTYGKQDSLLRLPVPTLKETCDKYIKTVEPLLSPEDLEHTKQAVAEFIKPGGIGEQLQEKLLERDKQQVPSWLEEWWDDAYLYGRESIAINVNYFFAFEDDPVRDKNDQIGRAASLLRGAMLFKQALDEGTLEPDMERDRCLDMSQHPRVFGATRIPGAVRDTLITYTKFRPGGRSAWSHTTEYVDMTPTHVVVIYRNQFYWFDVFRNGQLLPLSEIEAYLHRAIELAHSSENIEPPVGVLTAQDRPVWAEAREKLIAVDPANLKTLEKIQSALMVVVLDSSTPTSYDEVARVVLHGPVTNRWFDKHQLIVCANGKAGMCFEHAVGDGTTTLRLADEMYKYSVSHTRTSGIIMSSVLTIKVTPQKLHWKLTPEIMRIIEAGYESFKTQILANETSALVFEKFGGQFMKDSNISPDAFAQMAIQLAYYKLLGRCDATYESASTKQFLHGRTETVRTVSNESVAFVKSTRDPIMNIEDRQLKLSQQYKLLMAAANAHVKYMRDAKEGKGVDRHLFGLRMIFESTLGKQGIPTPSIFSDKAYRLSSHWCISTSHCGSSSLSLFGFGPVVSDGFGVGYMIKNNSISFTITSKNYQPWTSSALFKLVLEESLLHMQCVAVSHPDKLALASKSLNFTHPTSTAAFHYLDWKPESKSNNN